MPNYCNNYVTITHSDPAMVEKLFLAAQKDALCATFLPVPTDLPKSDVEGCMSDGEYNWRCDNWGTKWDIGEGLDKVDENTVEGFTDSAWAPPIGLWRALSEQGYGVHAYWHEGGMCFAGEYETDMGVLDYNNIEYTNEGLQMLPEEIVELFDLYDYVDSGMED
jgi:hypothetical protein